jgi:ABC-type sugar transport system substrate-binding protein
MSVGGRGGKMKRLVALVVVMGVFVAAGCGGGALSSGGGEDEELYVFLPKSLDNPYWVDARKGMKAEAKKLGVKAEFLGPQQADAGKQVEIFENALNRNPAGIALSANDPETVKATIAQAKEKDIPVIAWDSEVPDSEVLAYVGTDNVAAGEQAAEALAETMDEKGKVAVLAGSVTALNARQRLDGLKKGLKQYPDIEIVTTEITGESVSGATSKAENLLQAQSDIDALFGVTGADAPGAALAVKQAGKCGDIQVAGFDVVPQGQELMKEGCIQALISQRPYGMTRQALEMLHSLNKGEKVKQESVDTGVITVTEDSLDKFLKDAPH